MSGLWQQRECARWGRPNPVRTGGHKRIAYRISNVLTPTETKSEAQPAPSPSSNQGLWSAFSGAGQLLSQLTTWPSTPAPTNGVQEALRQASQAASPPRGKSLPDITRFLTPASDHELRHMRTLASLCNLTYYMGKQVTPRSIARRHNLELVTTSMCCERVVYEHSTTAQEALMEGDGMAVSLPQALQQYSMAFEHSEQNQPQEAQALRQMQANALSLPPVLVTSAAPAMATSNIVPFPKSPNSSSSSADSSNLAPGSGDSSCSSSGSTPPSSPEATHKQQPAPSAQAALLRQEQVESLALQGPQKGQAEQGWFNPADAVAAALSEASLAASAAASAAVQPLASAADSLSSAAGSLWDGGVSLVEGMSRATAPLLAASALDRVVGAAVARITSAEIATAHHNSDDHVRSGSSAPSEEWAGPISGSSNGGGCPSEWFVADDASTYTRYFVIQGSNSFDHWVTNVMFDPVPFEEGCKVCAGIKVHHGAYQAALALYDRFLPLVHEHMDSHPFARIAFTGHSIGGSMATLLMLMFVARGVLTPDQLAPVYTFGGTGVFCEGATGGAAAAAAAAAAAERSAASAVLADGTPSMPAGAVGGVLASSGVAEASTGGLATMGGGEVTSEDARAEPGGLLEALGLRNDMVRNVLMTYDLVPRAFACDYSLVAEILKTWGPSFREHSALSRPGRKQMYFFIGATYLLQPDRGLRFVAGDAPHPMLPAVPGGELYAVDGPTLAGGMRALAAAAAGSSDATGAGSGSVATAPVPAQPSVWAQAPMPPADASDVLALVMDNPHPLDILADPGAYGDQGSVSRYHNPLHYCRAIGTVLAQRRAEAAAALAAPSAVPAAAARQQPFFEARAPQLHVAAASSGDRNDGLAKEGPPQGLKRQMPKA